MIQFLSVAFIIISFQFETKTDHSCVVFMCFLIQLGGNEPREEVVKDIDRKLKVWRTSNPATNKGADAGVGKEKTDGREGKRHKSASKQEKHQQAVHDLEEAALDDP